MSKSNRIMVKLSASDSCIGFRTVSRFRKSPHWFYMTREELAVLDEQKHVVSRDLDSFAEFLSSQDGLLEIRFMWLADQGNDTVTGYKETVTLDYPAFRTFVTESLCGGRKDSSMLSIDTACRRPVLDFSAALAPLHRVLASPITRKKLSRALRDNFQWPRTPRISFFPDWDPDSFFFKEIRQDDRTGICGGLILHHEDRRRGPYYAVHT